MVEPTIDAEIVAHYEGQRPEDTRLRVGPGLVELRRTQQVVRRHLPDPPARVLDVGGASGVHAEWLAADGFEVHIVDPVPLHVEQAAAAGAAAARPFTASVGDARDLDAADDSVDVVLMLGPLYHLVERADRVRALGEARRAVRPGGLVIAAAISRFASLLDGVTRGRLAEPGFQAVVEQDLATGQHRNPTGRPDWFTTAYFHHPDELAVEVADAGLDVVEVVGVEGLSAWTLRADAGADHDEDLSMHLWAAGAVEHEPTLAGLSPHLLVVARAPAG